MVGVLALKRLDHETHFDCLGRGFDPLDGPINNGRDGVEIGPKLTLGLAGDFRTNAAEVLGLAPMGIRLTSRTLAAGKVTDAWHERVLPCLEAKIDRAGIVASILQRMQTGVGSDLCCGYKRVDCGPYDPFLLVFGVSPLSEQIRTTPGTSVALTIGGSDSCGGAGIQADLKTFAVRGVFGTSAITAITAQNTQAVKQTHVLEPDLIKQQIGAVASDMQVSATKTGMLPNAEIIKVVVKIIKQSNLFPLVVDPVMKTAGGDSLIDDASVATLIKKLIPLATIVTPNGYEAARLLDRADPITDLHGAATAAREICQRLEAKACVVTGIKRENDEEGEAVDLFFDGQELHEIVSDWRPTPNKHGAGCTFSAAITAGLALGQPIGEAISIAKSVIIESIRQATDLGKGISPVNHLAYLNVKK